MLCRLFRCLPCNLVINIEPPSVLVTRQGSSRFRRKKEPYSPSHCLVGGPSHQPVDARVIAKHVTLPDVSLRAEGMKPYAKPSREVIPSLFLS
jgi:hypothetical protein